MPSGIWAYGSILSHGVPFVSYGPQNKQTPYFNTIYWLVHVTETNICEIGTDLSFQD
jgi:hypothetical protein